MSHFLQFANCPDSSWLQRGSVNSSYFVVHLNIYQFISNENLRLCNTQSICKTFSTCCCNVNINMQLSSCSMFSLLINTAAVTYCQQTPQAALPLLSSWMKGTFLRTRSYQVAIFFLTNNIWKTRVQEQEEFLPAQQAIGCAGSAECRTLALWKGQGRALV